MTNYNSPGGFNDFEMQPQFEFSSELSEDNLNDLLINMVNHVLLNMYLPENYDKKLFCSSLDDVLIKLRDRCSIANNIKQFVNPINVVLCTDLSIVGGHSRIAFTFKSDNVRNYYIISDILNQNYGNLEKIEFLDKTIGKENYYFIPNGSPLQKLKLIAAEVERICPKFVSCFNHQFDPVSILTALFYKNCKRFYYHHCDHTVSIGSTIKEFFHIDTNDYINSICKNYVADGFTLPLSTPADVQSIQYLEIEAPISFISVGAHHKYDFENTEAPSYYPKIITLLLKNANTIFIHAGELSEKTLLKIYDLLNVNSIAKERFKYLGNISSIGGYFSQIKNKIFIPSFPRGGGLTFVEFLSLGTPMLFYKSSKNEAITSKSFASLANSSILVWETESDLIRCANKILLDYSNYSKNSIDLFNHKYSYEIYKYYLNKIF